MNIKTITDFNSVDIIKWAEFVKNHPKGNIFQTPEMFRVYKSGKHYEPALVVCLDESDEIVGLMVSVIQREYKGILGKLSSRSIIWGGPLIKDNNTEILKILLKEYDLLIKKKAIYTQIRNLWNQNVEKENIEYCGYKYEDHLNILIDLTKSEEILWKEVYSKRRNQIRNAIKKGVTIRLFTDTGLIDKSYDILLEVYKKAKLPLPDKEYFKTAIDILGEKGFIKCIGAFFENQLIGMMYILIFNSNAYEWYIGCYSDFANYNPNDLIIWETFKWCQKKHFRIYDFGGAGKPGIEYGVREFKKKFGGETVNLGRYQKVHNQLLMKCAVIGFKFWQLIKF